MPSPDSSAATLAQPLPVADRAIELSLVVPVYNAGPELEPSLAQLRMWVLAGSGSFELILVDDGSRASVRDALAEFARHEPNVRLIVNEKNSGKGVAVARGMQAATGRIRVFTDIDLAYKLEDVDTIIGHVERGADVVVACRVLPESRYTMSPAFIPYLFTRHVMSRIFNAFVRLTLLRGVRDTQAGLKGFRASAADVIFPRITIGGFAFDVECLVIAQRHGFSVTEMPVHFRYDSEPSTVNVLRDATRMAASLLRIFWNRMRGRYD
jgi:dolichyl-phosphate beta-glucosyltransferase